jgi:hypothetical protein
MLLKIKDYFVPNSLNDGDRGLIVASICCCTVKLLQSAKLGNSYYQFLAST